MKDSTKMLNKIFIAVGAFILLIALAFALYEAFG